MSNRKLALIALAAVAVVALVAVNAWAGCGTCGPKSSDPVIAGTVKSLCTHSNTLVLTTGTGDKAKDVTLKVCPKNTKVVIGGKAAKLTDVKVGAAATLGHKHAKKGGLFCTSITIGGGSA